MKLSSCAGIVGRDSVFIVQLSHSKLHIVLMIIRFTLYLAACCELVRLLILHSVLPALSKCDIFPRKENGHSLTTHTLSPLAAAQSSACCIQPESQRTSVTFVELLGKKSSLMRGILNISNRGTQFGTGVISAILKKCLLQLSF